ncbi:MAG TPA: formylmethanofuran dehydrogenase subunit C [Acetobacteraceae bacterium]
MSALRLVLRAPPEQRLDLSPLTPDRLVGLSTAMIERLGVGTTRAAVHVGDVFAVHDGDPATLVIEGGSERFDRVGEGMRAGALRLEGETGMRAGRALAGGHLAITGNVGPFAASGMTDGHMEIGGDAGAFLGGPLAGERAGMRGGIVVVRGRVGERAADRMRRGLIVVVGDTQRYAGSNMVAGTLIVCGQADETVGTLMRRGTIVLGRPCLPAPTFIRAGDADPVFRRLLARAVAPLCAEAAMLAMAAAHRFNGDMAAIGKGEVLMPS